MRTLLVGFSLFAIVFSSSAQWSTSGSNIYSNNSGNVGIGTSGPSEKLHLNGSIRGNQLGALRISTGNGYIDVGPKNADYAHFATDRPYGFHFGGNVTIGVNGVIQSASNTDLRLSTQSSSSFQPVTRMTIRQSNGNVGIGVATPTAQLEIADIYSAGGQNLKIGDDTYFSDVDVHNTLGLYGVVNNDRAGLKLGGNGPTLFGLNNALGIGTINPAYTLDVGGTARISEYIKFSNPTTQRDFIIGQYEPMIYGSTSGGGVFGSSSLILQAGGTLSDRHIYIRTADQTRVLIHNNGNVGIGNVSPTYLLDVNGIVNATALYVNGQPFSGSQWLTTESSIYYNNSVGIGKTPSYPLDVNGIINATDFYINGQPFSGSQWLNAGNNIYFNNAVGIGTDLTTNPDNYSLAVNGKVNATQLYSDGQLVVSSQWTSSDSDIVYNIGSVGIGTSLENNPGNYKLSVGGKINATELYANDQLMISSQWATSGTNVLYNNGAVGIGTTLNNNPNNYKLSVGGKINATELYTNDKLVVSSQWTTSNDNIYYNGPVGIGTPLASNPNNYSLAVNGKVGAKEFRVEKTSATWPDYVFESTYELPSLTEVEYYIKEHKHLKDVPSQKEVEKDGHSLGDMDAVLLKKIEELTLYVIDLEKKNKDQEKENKELISRLDKLEKMITDISK